MYPDYISAKKMRENYEGNVFSCMGCRSFLSPWKDETESTSGKAVLIRALSASTCPDRYPGKGNEEKFWKLLDERLELCYEALMCRHKALEGVVSDVSPIHWQYGAIARLPKGAPIEPLLYGGYSSISLGYIGLYELTYVMTGQSHTSPEGLNFALQVMQHLKDTVMRWRSESNIASPSTAPRRNPSAIVSPRSTGSATAPSKMSPTRGTTPTPTT